MASAERGVSTCGSRNMYSGNSDAVRDVRWSPTDGGMFATATDSGAIQLWDYRKVVAPLMRIAAHDKPCFSVDWHPDGKYLVSGGTDRQVKVWDFSPTAERRQKPTFQYRTPQGVLNVRWRPPFWSGGSQALGDWQSTQVVTSYDREDPRIHLWDLRRPHIPFREFDRYDTLASDLLWHSKDLLWTVGEGGAFTQTDVRYAPQVINRRPMCSVAWSPSGDVLAFVQKRPRRTPNSNTTEFLHPREEERSNGETARSQSPDDEILDEATFTSYSWRDSRSRSSKSFSSTPPSTGDGVSVFPLDKSLSKGKATDLCQLGVIGTVPGTTTDPETFRYLGRHYSPLIEDSDKQNSRSVLLSLLASFDDNAECAEEMSLFRLAQTWRVAKFALIQELQHRAREQRKPHHQNGNSNVRKKASNEGLPTEKFRPAGDPKNERVKSRLFKGVMETEGQRSLLPDVENTSNMTTPLAQPLPDSPPPASLRSTGSEDAGVADIPPLPPSVLSSNFSTVNSNDVSLSDVDSRRHKHRASDFSEDGFVQIGSMSDQTHQSVPPDPETEQRSAPRAINTGSADWHAANNRRHLPKEASDEFEQKIEDKRAALRDYRQCPKKLLSLEPSVETTTKPRPFVRHGSSESFPMFSTSTDSSHPTKSAGASFSPKSASPLDRPNMSDANSDASGEASAPEELEPRTLRDDEEDSEKEMSFEESNSVSSNVHLQRPSSPTTFLAESDPLKLPGDDTIATGEPSPLSIPGVTEDLSKTSIPMVPDMSEDKPWSVEVLLREAIRFYRSSIPLDIQSAAHLLQKLHVLFKQRDKILPYEECESIFKTYNESLLRQSMYVEAAELRLLCVPTYPAVYEYAQVDSYINVFCFTCRRPYENPKRDNTRCHRCNTAQQPCPICMSMDPPPEWVAAQSTSSPNDEPEPETTTSQSSSSSPSLTATEPISTSDVETPTIPRPKGSALWTWCQGCGHGGHLTCMTMWLDDPETSEGGCATAGCMHDCGPGPRREHNRALLQQETKRRDTASRRAGVGFVKRDPWTRGESRAVEKVRGMLGRASSSTVSSGRSSANTATAAAATTAAAANATGNAQVQPPHDHPHGGNVMSGMLSPKKVRLVTPSEQGKRRGGGGVGGAGGAGGGVAGVGAGPSTRASNAAGNTTTRRDRESQADSVYSKRRS